MVTFNIPLSQQDLSETPHHPTPSLFIFPDLNSQGKGTENKKRYSEIFRSLDALEISLGNEYVSQSGFLVLPEHYAPLNYCPHLHMLEHDDGKENG